MSNPGKKPRKCSFDTCKKKIQLSCINCGYCKIYYCLKHRLPEQHSCPHDFKKMHEKQAVELANSMRCVAPKVDIINA
jgi:predicted nucleic acid binding AN1-type Zn finger protein